MEKTWLWVGNHNFFLEFQLLIKSEQNEPEGDLWPWVGVVTYDTILVTLS